MPASVVIEHLTGAPPGTAVAVTAVRFRSDDGDGRDQGAPVQLPHNVSTTLTQAVAPSPDPQAVDVVNSAFFSAGDCAIVDAGDEVRQEVVKVLSLPDAGSLRAVFSKAHPAGAPLALVKAAVSKTFRVNISSAPDNSIANISFCRAGALPSGVYDQWRIPVTYVQGGSEPWHSSSSAVHHAVPASPQMIARGPWSGAESSAAIVEIQWLFTAAAKTVPETVYRFSWDEA